MRQTWSVDLDGDRHTVEYRRPWWAHHGVILVDGAAVSETTEPWDSLGWGLGVAPAGVIAGAGGGLVMWIGTRGSRSLEREVHDLDALVRAAMTRMARSAPLSQKAFLSELDRAGAKSS